jgi:hypothetical protein
VLRRSPFTPYLTDSSKTILHSHQLIGNSLINQKLFLF